MTGSAKGSAILGGDGPKTCLYDTFRPVGGGSGVWLRVAVLYVDDHVVSPGQLALDPVRHGDRAVAAAGAADRDRQVTLALGDVGRHEELEQRQQTTVELARLGPGLDVLAHPFVEAGQRPQIIDVVRVGQKAHVEGEVGIARWPVLE